MALLNLQPAEKVEDAGDGSLEIVGLPWYTIQGEGPFAGTPAVFVRLAGCVHQCKLCDTDYTSYRRWMPPEKLVAAVEEAHYHPCLVVITGGEPFRQNLKPLIDKLLAEQYRVQIETSGSLYQDLPYDDITIVCSPKTAYVHPKLAGRIAAYKYVIEAGQVDSVDGLPLSVLGEPRRPYRPPYGASAEVYVQPVDSQDRAINAANTDAAVKSCMRFGYRLCLQMHKIVGVP